MALSATFGASSFDWTKPFPDWITGGFSQQVSGTTTSGYSAPIEDDYLDMLAQPKIKTACRHPKLPKDSCFEKLPCPDCQKLVKI